MKTQKQERGPKPLERDVKMANNIETAIVKQHKSVKTATIKKRHVNENKNQCNDLCIYMLRIRLTQTALNHIIQNY